MYRVYFELDANTTLSKYLNKYELWSPFSSRPRYFLPPSAQSLTPKTTCKPTIIFFLQLLYWIMMLVMCWNFADFDWISQSLVLCLGSFDIRVIFEYYILRYELEWSVLPHVCALKSRERHTPSERGRFYFLLERTDGRYNGPLYCSVF